MCIRDRLLRFPCKERFNLYQNVAEHHFTVNNRYLFPAKLFKTLPCLLLYFIRVSSSLFSVVIVFKVFIVLINFCYLFTPTLSAKLQKFVKIQYCIRNYLVLIGVQVNLFLWLKENQPKNNDDVLRIWACKTMIVLECGTLCLLYTSRCV